MSDLHCECAGLLESYPGDKDDGQHAKARATIYRNEPALEWSLYVLDTGSLLQQLTVPRSRLTDGINSIIRLEPEQTHEWELLIGIALAGGTAFFEAALSEPGKRFVG